MVRTILAATLIALPGSAFVSSASASIKTADGGFETGYVMPVQERGGGIDIGGSAELALAGEAGSGWTGGGAPVRLAGGRVNGSGVEGRAVQFTGRSGTGWSGNGEAVLVAEAGSGWTGGGAPVRLAGGEFTGGGAPERVV